MMLYPQSHCRELASEAEEEATILNRINKKTLELFIGVNFVGYVVQQGESLYTS